MPIVAGGGRRSTPSSGEHWELLTDYSPEECRERLSALLRFGGEPGLTGRRVRGGLSQEGMAFHVSARGPRGLFETRASGSFKLAKGGTRVAVAISGSELNGQAKLNLGLLGVAAVVAAVILGFSAPLGLPVLLLALAVAGVIGYRGYARARREAPDETLFILQFLENAFQAKAVRRERAGDTETQPDRGSSRSRIG
jgi:hypothetical protein